MYNNVVASAPYFEAILKEFRRKIFETAYFKSDISVIVHFVRIECIKEITKWDIEGCLITYNTRGHGSKNLNTDLVSKKTQYLDDLRMKSKELYVFLWEE